MSPQLSVIGVLAPRKCPRGAVCDLNFKAARDHRLDIVERDLEAGGDTARAGLSDCTD
jgi:hypothetical protein